MANPNIVNVTAIYGKLAIANLTTSVTDLVSNTAGSNKVFKINSLTIANVDGVNAADVTVDVYRNAGASIAHIAKTVTVPADSTIVIISKDSSIYLNEADILRCVASAAGDLDAVCSYEEIS